MSRIWILLLIGLLAASNADAAADETLVLRVNQARLVPLLTPPARLYLDDPALAQLRSPEPNQVLILPRATGRTMLHALTEDGAPLATIALDIEAADADADKVEALQAIAVTIAPNKGVSLPLIAPAERVFVNDPRIAGVTMTQPDTILVTGRAVGRTSVYALDAQGARVGLYDITVGSAPAVPDPMMPSKLAITDAVELGLPEGRLVDLPRPAASAVAENPGMLEVRAAGATKLFLVAKAPGRTLVKARDARGKLVAVLQVTVTDRLP